MRGPSVPFEVIVVDDGSDEPVLETLQQFSSMFPWKFIRFNAAEFESKTGLKKFLNNPCVTNNIGFKHAQGDYIFQQGNEIIAWDSVYNHMIADAPKCDHWMVMSTTYDIPGHIVDMLDPMGQNLLPGHVAQCEKFPLQSHAYRSDVTNYICLAPRKVWEGLGGYDERYYGGISAEDSDFVRRARKLPGFQQVISDGVSLHQYHGGKTAYYNPPPSYITKERWNEGVAINHAIFHAWNEQSANPQKWPFGTFGVGEVITNIKDKP